MGDRCSLGRWEDSNSTDVDEVITEYLFIHSRSSFLIDEYWTLPSVARGSEEMLKSQRKVRVTGRWGPEPRPSGRMWLSEWRVIMESPGQKHPELVWPDGEERRKVFPRARPLGGERQPP